ncbi:EamA-like transporter family protein [Novosphingobium kunmingense]|uniref:EamA-like transporter family protein n=1 Tax=Novosphingobium kunmingense TaxID=1211806 RepID=A0A2N0H726_9SPHN|nr:DMT family transporter [Novosphingobium kunmingense]PKB14732.1 EamA-like transporter family protein [Novosphingobium kunmingense]
MGNATGPARNWNGWHFAALIGGNAALSLGPWFVRLADTGPVAAGFWRLLLPLPLLAGIALASRQRLIGFAPGVWWAIAGAGTFFALDLAAWHVGILYTRLGNATLFGNAGSLVVMAWGMVALRRWPYRGEWLAFGLALLGAAILFGRSLEIDRTTLIGDLFCVLAGLLYAGYIILLQRPRASAGNWALVFWSSLVGVPVLLAVATALGETVMPNRWWPLIGLALCSQVIGQGLLIFALRHFSPLVFGLALLCQPVVAVALGWLAFGEVLGVVDLVGMILVASALVMARNSARDEA